MLTGLLIGGGLGLLVGAAVALFGPVLVRKAKEQLGKLGE